LRVRVDDVVHFEGALSRYNKETTIAILITRYANRAIWLAREMDIFTDCAIARAISSEYKIILTDELHVYSDLINFIELNPLDSSNIEDISWEVEKVSQINEEILRRIEDAEDRFDRFEERCDRIEKLERHNSFLMYFIIFMLSAILINIFYK